NPQFPFWSPDSEFIAFISAAKLWRVPVDTGSATVIGPAAFNVAFTTPGGVWRADGSIVFAPAASGSGLLAVPARGGDFIPLLGPDPEKDDDFHKPSLLPESRGILYVLDRKEGGADTLEVLVGQTRRTLLRIEGEWLDSPSYSPSGHIVFWRRSTN